MVFHLDKHFVGVIDKWSAPESTVVGALGNSKKFAFPFSMPSDNECLSLIEQWISSHEYAYVSCLPLPTSLVTASGAG